jgi:EAL domain-containing protein (putative c-di-GMP-specific phosphodiesterase class I)
MDDFGSGHSPLSHLKLLPIQRLKIDRSLVREIESDGQVASICGATIALAHALGLEVNELPGATRLRSDAGLSLLI